ncbi:hypothetical protein [Xanthomarina spongicola]|uniref:ATP synthase protein I n=1 Tax=Xanthomarina spongicola TaxID=570520 RepID=A0A316DS09_9FLAO|nr:hypothetical protein [Xanthomarina spongicola]PWK20606.1 hypothetical protein LX78_00308 [Xanthomarina spongicola]
MNPAFKSRQLSFLIQNIAVTLILFGIHSYLLYHFAENINYIIPLWQVYVFHFVVTTLLYSVINFQYSRGKTEIFNIFMGFTFLKMILAIVFLLPVLLSDTEHKQPDVFNFFIPYFLYLFFEVFSLTSFLQKKP